MKAEHLADAPCRFGCEQRRSRRSEVFRSIGEQGGVIVYKREYTFIGRIPGPAGALIAGAEIACGIVMQGDRRGGLRNLALPGPLGAMGRNQDPRLPQRIPAPVRKLPVRLHDPIVKSRTAHVSREPWKGPDPGLAAVSELLRLAEPLAIAGAVANYD